MARLIADTWVKDPQTRLMVHLRAGEEPSAEYAALVTNPDAWEDGKAPNAKPSKDSAEDDGDTKQAAKKSAARKPARGRSAATEGEGGD